MQRLKTLCSQCDSEINGDLTLNYKYRFCNEDCHELYSKKYGKSKKKKTVSEIQGSLLEWVQEEKNENMDFEAEMDELWHT